MQVDVSDALVNAQAAAMARREGLLADLRSLTDASRDVATDDEHDPEGATIAYERSKLSTLVAEAEEQLAEVQAGLDRLAAGTYGRCEQCGNAISQARLEALPATRTCIACAEKA